MVTIMCGEVLILSRPMQTALRELTPKQRAFADALLDGKSGSVAYRSAYNSRGNNRVVARKAAGAHCCIVLGQISKVILCV